MIKFNNIHKRSIPKERKKKTKVKKGYVSRIVGEVTLWTGKKVTIKQQFKDTTK